MKVLVATEKPFAKVAVDGIRKEVEAAGYELVLLEKYTEKQQLLDAVKGIDAMIVRSDIIDKEVLQAADQGSPLLRCKSAENVNVELLDEPEYVILHRAALFRGDHADAAPIIGVHHPINQATLLHPVQYA